MTGNDKLCCYALVYAHQHDNNQRGGSKPIGDMNPAERKESWSSTYSLDTLQLAFNPYEMILTSRCNLALDEWVLLFKISFVHLMESAYNHLRSGNGGCRRLCGSKKFKISEHFVFGGQLRAVCEERDFFHEDLLYFRDTSCHEADGGLDESNDDTS
ncbi:hypothetical protein BDV96DRAFT_694113 [Lophiotrema nucula]|uniref:Uncharacterized protein n=1 Tax=Lophiotrema nucula TaxID=690887 RepID=A0A6A5YH60_9PLEO|nr:hypothetical protein BDV96DRAFT_694113 [Lophiotrema nucula]